MCMQTHSEPKAGSNDSAFMSSRALCVWSLIDSTHRSMPPNRTTCQSWLCAASFKQQMLTAPCSISLPMLIQVFGGGLAKRFHHASGSSRAKIPSARSKRTRKALCFAPGGRPASYMPQMKSALLNDLPTMSSRRVDIRRHEQGYQSLHCHPWTP